MSTEKPKIACLPNGPYYLLNDQTPRVIPNIQKSNGDPCATIPGVALCRCGGSNNKPFCDRLKGSEPFNYEDKGYRPNKGSDSFNSALYI